ncbi:histidine kinase [Streptomyces sp. NPDC047000]|uniref:sensor histidine kinase n=1 Tax=Streptomyces sp. NPDC047000 TaxID=3155474 RepID=UPI0033E36674
MFGKVWAVVCGAAGEAAGERVIRPVAGWWRSRGETARDGALALALAAVAFLPGLAANGIRLGELAERRLDLWGVLLGLAQCLPLVLRRRSPVLCLTLIAAAFAADQALGYLSSFGSVGLLLALYSAGAHAPRRRRPVAAVATVAYAALAAVLHRLGSPERAVEFVTFWLVLAACWTAGGWMRARRRHEEERRLHTAQLAVAEERARIARELHDVVTHHVTAMVVQSDAARFLLPTAPDRVADGLTAIGSTGRRALVELRFLLDVLDTGKDAGTTGTTGDAAVRTPGRIGDLVAAARAAGQPVEFAERGDPRPLHGTVALAAYRVVQEALTNAVKHAPGRPVRVRLSHDPEGIEIDVTNEGTALVAAGARTGDAGSGEAPAVLPPSVLPPSGGRGLAGLGERVAALGGDLTAGPTGDGGFRVRTRLPLRDVR